MTRCTHFVQTDSLLFVKQAGTHVLRAEKHPATASTPASLLIVLAASPAFTYVCTLDRVLRPWKLIDPMKPQFWWFETTLRQKLKPHKARVHTWFSGTTKSLLRLSSHIVASRVGIPQDLSTHIEPLFSRHAHNNYSNYARTRSF